MEYFVSAPIRYGLGCLNPTYFISIVEPKLVRKHIRLHSLATLIVIFIGLRLFGIVGIIVFPVALSVMVNLEKGWNYPF